MKFINIGFIVEGAGEIEALPILARRIVQKIDETVFISEKTDPIRIARNLIAKPGVLESSVELAAQKVGRGGGILILLDADDDRPAQLALELLARANRARSDVPIAVVLATREYEAWFLASALSLRGKHGLSEAFEPPVKLEAKRGAKEWLSKHMPNAQ